MRRFLIETIILILISSTLIFYKFNQIPKNLTFDEVEFTKLASSLDKNSYIPYSPLATGHPTLYFYFLLFSFKIFGLNNIALRFPSAFFGAINVFLFYLIARKAFSYSNYQLPITTYFFFLLSLIFLTSRWYFNFARFAFEATFLLFLELFSTLFLFNYFQSKRTIPLILSFVFAGFAFHSYQPGRIFFILPLFFILLKVIKQHNLLIIKQLTISFIVFLLVIAPLVIYFFNHPDVRFNQQFFLSNSDLSLVKKGEFLGRNVLSTSLMFFWRGDVNGRHNYPLKPALNPILFFFFILGLIFSFRNLKNFYNQFFLFYFIISLIPAILTYPWENPNMLRSFTVLPSVIFFVGRGIESLIVTTLKRPSKSGNSKTLFLTSFILFLLFISSFYELRTYFKYQAKVFENAFEVKENLEVLIKR